MSFRIPPPVGARLRELLWWCLPALVVGFVLRAILTWQMPWGYYHFDSPDFLTTPESLLFDHRFELHMKKTFLVPLVYTVPFLLHVPALIFIPVFQHLLGLGLIVLVGYLCQLWFDRWKWFIIPLTLSTAGNPALLWFEHTLIAETLFVFCTVILAVAGTLYAAGQTRNRFLFLCAALFLEAGARPEGKLFFAFGLLLVALLHWQDWRRQWPRFAAMLVLGIGTHFMTRTSQAGLLLYTSVARLTPGDLHCAPGFEPFIAAERADLQTRWLEKPSFPKVADRRIIAMAVENYLKAAPDDRLGDRHRRVNSLCLKLALETCRRNLPALPGHLLAKFRATACDAPNGLFDHTWLYDAQDRAYSDEAAHTLRLSRGLTGTAVTSVEEMQGIVSSHYQEVTWFNTWSDRWFAVMNAWRLPDTSYRLAADRRLIVFGVPFYFLIGTGGLLAIALQRGPLQSFHLAWSLMLIGAFLVIMLTANVKPRFRVVFEPFWFIYTALILELAATTLLRICQGTSLAPSPRIPSPP